MKLEDQVTSLELSKKLKELGVKQESYFYHALIDKLGFEKSIISIDPEIYLSSHYTKKDQRTAYIYDIPNDNYLVHSTIVEMYSAFSVAELGEILPSYCKKSHSLSCEKIEPLYFVSYRMDGTLDYYFEQKDKKESDARAKMLIYLIENNLVKVEDINNEMDQC